MDENRRASDRRGLLRVAAAAALVLAVVALWWFFRTDDGAPAPPNAATAPATAPEAPVAPTPAERPRRVRPTPADETPVESAEEPESPKPGPFRVVVVEAAGGAPVAEADVRVLEADDGTGTYTVGGRTGADGAVHIEVRREWCRKVIVRKTGFLTTTQDLERPRPEVRVVLTAGIPVRGRVVMSGTGDPVAGAVVRPFFGARAVEGHADAGQVTTADGRFEIAGVESGRTIRIFAVKPGFCWADAIVDVSPSLGDVEIVLGLGGILDGTVLDVEGRPVAGADVFVLPENGVLPRPEWSDEFADGPYDSLRGSIFPSIRTGPDGKFEFRGVVLPRPGVTANRIAAARTADGREARSEPATFTKDGERQTRDVRFLKDGRILVRVTSASPLPDYAKVRVQSGGLGGVDTTQHAPTDDAPDVFGALPAGHYSVTLSIREGTSVRWEEHRTVILGPGEDATVEFSPEGQALAGRVQDVKGRGIAGQRVDLTAKGRLMDNLTTASAVTGDDGRFEFRYLPKTSWWLKVTSDTTRSVARDEDAPRYEDWSVDRVRPGAEPLVIVLRERGRITGRVVWTDAARREKGADVTVSARGASTTFDFRPEEDSGRFVCDAPRVGDPMEVWFECDGCAPTVLRVGAVGPGETREIGEIVLGPGTTFEACFVDAGGAPLEQAEVTTPDPWMPRGAQATGPAGTVRLTKVPLHPFVLHIGPTSKTPATFVRADPSASSATFTIREGALIEGRVVDALARPVAGAVVRFRSLRDEVTGTETDDSVLADAEGRFACRLRAGRATIRAYSADQRSIIDDVELTVSEGEHRAVNFAAQ